MKWIISLLVGLCIAPAFAESAGYPCQGCLNDRASFSAPSSALWYAVERPGTGLSLTVQGRFVVGVYYSYTETGAPLWYLFTGPLQQPADAPNRWRLMANLQRVENGPCLGCAWHAPDFLPSPGQATLEFDQANHATFAIDGGAPLSMVPFVAGVGYVRLFPSYTDYDFPDLNGTWVAVHEVPQSDGSLRYSSHIGEFILSQYPIADEKANWRLLETYDPTDQYVALDMECRFNEGVPGQPDIHSREVPDCWLSDLVEIPRSELGVERLYFPIPYANIGASRISAVHAETGVRLTMYRLEYD